MFSQIETPRLILRQFTESDALAACYNSKQPTVTHFMSDMILDTKEDALNWIRWINNDKFDISIPCVVLAVELKSNQKCIGLIGVAPKYELDNEIEILFEIADEHQNQGYVTEAGKAIIKWAFEYTPVTHLVAIVKKDNPASSRVIEKLGFNYSGEKRIDYDGQMTDFHYYELNNYNNKIHSVKQMKLETERLIIRPYYKDDFQECFELMQDGKLFKYLDMEVMTDAEYRKLFDWLIDCYNLDFSQDFKYSFNIILKETGAHIGWCGIGGLETNHDQKEIYYLIGSNYQGNGYAKEAATALLEYGFTTIGLPEIVACCKPDNIASRKVIESIGLKFKYYLEGLQEEFYNGEPFFSLTSEEYFNESTKYPKIVNVREHPEYLDRAVDYFSSKWGIDRQIYHDSISDSITTNNSLPRWYLMLDNDKIVGSFGLIENDFMVRKDLKPWLCALYVEESERCKGLGGKLLAHGQREACKLGFDKLYLCTDHTGYYEKYGWQFFGMEESEFGGQTRVYKVECEE